MLYFVILPDGQKFGPADLNLINQWVAEGRVLPNTVLEEAQTGRRFAANTLQGIQVVQAQPPGAYPAPGTMNPPTPYPRGGSLPGSDTGQNDLNIAFTFGAIGVACSLCTVLMLPFPIIGLLFAKKATIKGHPSANSATILCWVAIVCQVAGLVVAIFN